MTTTDKGGIKVSNPCFQCCCGSYNFKGSEVDQESLEHVPELELDDLDMDSVYD